MANALVIGSKVIHCAARITLQNFILANTVYLLARTPSTNERRPDRVQHIEKRDVRTNQNGVLAHVRIRYNARMDRTQLEAVERRGYWAVRITWPNGAKHYFGKYNSEREANQWIEKHGWLTAARIENGDLVRRGRMSGGDKSQT